MNKQTKLINILQLAIALMGIIMLFFPVLTYIYESRYSSTTYLLSDTGFNLLKFEGDAIDSDYGIILGPLSWAQLITGVVISILASINLYKQKCSSYNIFIPIWISSLLYLIEGLAAASITISNGYTAYTSAWRPFITITILSIIVIVQLNKNKNASYSTTEEKQYYHQQPKTTYQASQQPTQQTQTDNSLFTVNGEVKTLKLYDNYLTMETKVNARAILTNNLFGGVKKIFYKNILSVQFKESSNFILGFIQFETANSSTKDNFNSENSVTFDYRKVPNEYAKQVADFVESKIMESNTPVVTQQATSAADELIKFKNLLDMGVISQEDFDKKKNELLK